MLRLMLKHGIEVKYLHRVLVNMAPGGNSGGSVSTIMKANLEVARAWRERPTRWGAGASVEACEEDISGYESSVGSLWAGYGNGFPLSR